MLFRESSFSQTPLRPLMHVVHGRAGVQARVRGQGAGAGQVLAETRLRGHEIPLRLPPASLHIQVSTFLSCVKPPLPFSMILERLMKPQGTQYFKLCTSFSEVKTNSNCGFRVLSKFLAACCDSVE